MLYLAGKEFNLVVGNKAVQLIQSLKSKPSARLERWGLRLIPFKFKIRHELILFQETPHQKLK